MTDFPSRSTLVGVLFALAAIGFGCTKPITLMGLLTISKEATETTTVKQGSLMYATVIELTAFTDSVITGRFGLYHMGTSINDKYRVAAWDFNATRDTRIPDYFEGKVITSQNKTPVKADSILIVRRMLNDSLRSLSGYLIAAQDSSSWNCWVYPDSLVERSHRPRPGDRYFKE